MSSIKQRPDGKWRARYRDDAGKEHSRHFDRKRDGQDWLDEVATSVRTGAYVDPARSKTTLEAFYAEWSPRQVWEPNTVLAMNQALAACTFLDVPFGALRRSHVETWVKTMDQTLAATTIRTRFSNVHAVLRAAVRDRVLAVDPADGVTLPRRRRAAHTMTIPSTAAVAAVLDAAEPWFANYIRVCAFAGLRLAEAIALQLDDVDFLRRNIGVRRQIQYVSGERLVTLPKHGSERDVFAADELLTELGRHVRDIGVTGEEQWLFAGLASPSRSSVNSRWVKTLKAAGVTPFKLHDLRHFYASGLIAAGCDVVTVQRALGHSSASITLSTYSHLWPDAGDRTRAAASGLICAVSADSSRTEVPQVGQLAR